MNIDVIFFIRIIGSIFAAFLFYKSYYLWKLTLPEQIKSTAIPKIFIPNEFKKELQFFISARRDTIFNRATVNLLAEKLNLLYDHQTGFFFKFLNNNILYKFFNNEAPNSFLDDTDFQTKSFEVVMFLPFGTDNLSAYENFIADIKEMAAICNSDIRDKNQKIVANFQKYKLAIVEYHKNFLRYLEIENSKI